MQLRRHSLLEVCLNTASGFAVSFLVGLVVYPWFGWVITPGQNFWIVAIYTGVSLVRSYFWRRFFNWLAIRGLLCH